MYKTTLNDGKKIYGSDFISSGYLAALHSTNSFCYHGGDMFSTAHPALQLVFEKSLRAIDPVSCIIYNIHTFSLPGLTFWKSQGNFNNILLGLYVWRRGVWKCMVWRKRAVPGWLVRPDCWFKGNRFSGSRRAEHNIIYSHIHCWQFEHHSSTTGTYRSLCGPGDSKTFSIRPIWACRLQLIRPYWWDMRQ